MKTVITIEEQKDGKLGVRMEFCSSNNDFTSKERSLVDKIAKLLPKKSAHVCLQWPIQAIEIAEDDDGLKIFVYDGEGYTDKQRRLMDAIVKQFQKDARVEFVEKEDDNK